MIIIFDYFETLLNNGNADFNSGLKVIWEKNYKDRCSFEDMKVYGEELLEQLLAKHREYIEFPFVKEELPLFAEKFGGEVVTMTEEEEADFLMLCNEFEMNSGVESFLEKCSQKNIPMYVLSNSGFRAGALLTVLNRFGLGKYFRNLWSSADFGRTKPCRDFFELAIETALKDNPTEKREDIVYIGDIYETDIVGAAGAGIKSVWLNKSGEKEPDKLATYVVGNVDDLLDVEYLE